MNKNELRLLRTYADGPRTWDVTEGRTVSVLTELGLVEPAGRGSYQLTDEGRRAVTHDHGPAHPPGTVTNCVACVRIREAEHSLRERET